MKSKHTLRVIAAAVLSIVSVPTALAQYSDSYYYLGGGIGKARVEINDERVTRPLFGTGLTATNINRDNHDTAYKLFGVYESGALGQVEVAWTATGWQEAFWVFGTEGSLEYDNTLSDNTLRHRTRTSEGTAWAQPDMHAYQFHGRASHHGSVGNFVAAVKGSGPVVCTGEDGLEAVRLVMASYGSAASGLPVEVGSLKAR